MSNGFKFRMPAGIAGDVTRMQASIIEAVAVKGPGYLWEDKAPGDYGVPAAIDKKTGQLRRIRSGDTSADVYGLTVRPYPTQGGGAVSDVLVRGYMTVKLHGAAASTKNGAVYVRIAKETDDKPAGGIEAAPDDKNTFVLSGAHFMGEADASGNVEISFRV